jgi:hypothetical protein
MKLLFIICLSLISTRLFADSWTEPTIKRYYSKDSVYFVEIVPTKIPEKYWEWKGAKAKKKHKYTPADTTIIHSHAKMYRIENRDTVKVWEQKLVNPHTPITALVSADGKYLITFDDWYNVGYGPNVFVVYNEKGELLKQYSLKDFSPFPIDDYSLSISSIWWRCGADLLSEERLRICFIDANKTKRYRGYNIATLQFDE